MQRSMGNSFLRLLAAASVLAALAACGDDAGGSAEAERGAPAAHGGSDAGPASEREAGAARDAALQSDAATVPSSSRRPKCDSAQPIPPGDLQKRASGSSVFGRVVGGDAGFYDPYGMTDCGVGGATICLADSSTCTQSDEAGQFVLLGLPESAAVEITLEKPGFDSALRLVELATTPINLFETRLLTSSTAETAIEAAGVEVDRKLGTVVAVATTPGEAIGAIDLPSHAAMTLIPGAIAPLYSLGTTEPEGLSSDTLDPSLTETKEGGWALFPNVPAGDYTVHIEHKGTACIAFVSGYSLGTDTHGDRVVKVRAGFTTTTAAYCP